MEFGTEVKIKYSVPAGFAKISYNTGCEAQFGHYDMLDIKHNVPIVSRRRYPLYFCHYINLGKI